MNIYINLLRNEFPWLFSTMNLLCRQRKQIKKSLHPLILVNKKPSVHITTKLTPIIAHKTYVLRENHNV